MLNTIVDAQDFERAGAWDELERESARGPLTRIPPLGRSGTLWPVNSPEDAWNPVGGGWLTKCDLDRWLETALEVLGSAIRGRRAAPRSPAVIST